MASISEPFIRRPVGTTLLAIGLFLIGVVAYAVLPVASVPNVDFPMIRVSANRPGASPSVMAATVAAPLERRLGEIAGVEQMTSTSALVRHEHSIAVCHRARHRSRGTRRASGDQRIARRSADGSADIAETPQGQSCCVTRLRSGANIKDHVDERHL